ncbi:MAG: zf-HC2 domain-containing protein [Gemmatimonadota bacterium]
MLTRLPADVAAAPACVAARAQVFAACDGELTPDQVSALDAHLNDCAECRTRFTTDVTFHRAVRAAVSLDSAPASLRDRILLSLTTHTTENAPA